MSCLGVGLRSNECHSSFSFISFHFISSSQLK